MPWGATPSPPTPSPPGLCFARAKGPAVRPAAPLSLFRSPPLPPPFIPVLFVRPVLVCHDDNKRMLMEAAVAVGPRGGAPLSPLPAQSHQISVSGAEHPWTRVMGRGEGMGNISPLLSPLLFLLPTSC